MFFLLSVFALSITPRRPRIQKKQTDGYACMFCKGIATGAKDFINFPLDDISSKLLTNCYTVAQTDVDYYQMCRELSTTYVSILVHLVKSGVSPEAICVKLGYCSDLESTGRFSHKYARLHNNHYNLRNHQNNNNRI